MADPIAAHTVVRRLGPDEQRVIAVQARAIIKASPLVRPHTPNGLPMRVRVSSCGALGWVGDGAYRYSPRDGSGRLWPPMPERWKLLASMVAGDHAWDSAILNWYADDAALGWHQDRGERDTSLPIVTISLGDACSWAIRADEGSPVSRCRLESGDVTLLAGPTRGYLHTVERIIPAPLFSPLDKPGRLSITLRVAG